MPTSQETITFCVDWKRRFELTVEMPWYRHNAHWDYQTVAWISNVAKQDSLFGTLSRRSCSDLATVAY